GTEMWKKLSLTVFTHGAHLHLKYTDISVECGTTSIDLAILICPVVYTGYNESLLILNHVSDKTECKGTLDESVTPPVVRFTFPINMTNACGSTFLVSRGVFADFSNVQMVNVSGVVHSHDPTTGIVTYNTELKYYYSCAYPLEYLINNTQVDVSGSSIAVRDNNGSFISTLSMELFSCLEYKSDLLLLLNVPAADVHCSVPTRYHVLMDRCYASISPHPTNSSFFNLFVSCSQDQMTTMHENGDSQYARFSFPAFRFVEQKNQTVSTYYLHCITRLCEVSTCNDFKVSEGSNDENTSHTHFSSNAGIFFSSDYVPFSFTNSNVTTGGKGILATFTLQDLMLNLDFFVKSKILRSNF
uniref:Si:ch211-103f14.3 n=1 Tax=Stegastes partitus TaxID=144197 RepID=A0A3B5ADK4_9TELE